MSFQDGPLKDGIVDENEEPEEAIIAEGFGSITDIEIGPDGYLYILTNNKGGHNCNESNSNVCIKYSSGGEGATFRIAPKKGV